MCFGIRGVPDFFQSLEGVRFHRFARLEKELPGVRELLPGFEAAEELRPDSFLQLIFITAVGVIKSASAAFVKLPARAAARNVSTSGLRIGNMIETEYFLRILI